MKRTTRRIIGATAFEFHMPVDDFDDVDTSQQILNKRLRNHARDGCSTPELATRCNVGESGDYRAARNNGSGSRLIDRHQK